MRSGTGIAVALLLFVLTAAIAAVPAASGSAPRGSALPTLTLTDTAVNAGVPLAVSFSATLSPPGLLATFNWSFGDGDAFQAADVASSSPVHQFNAPGEYLVEVTAYTVYGTAETNVVVSVAPGPLSVSITPSAAVGTAPLTVDFSGSVGGGTGTYRSIVWGFGDGGTGSGLQLNYTFSTPGTFAVYLTVIDSAGVNATATVEVDVVAPATPAGGPSTPGLPVDVALVAAFVALAAMVVVVRVALRPLRSVGAVPPGARLGPGEAPVPAGTRRGRTPPPTLPSTDLQDAYERVLTHLYWSSRRSGDSPGRSELTREGIARELRVAPSTVGRALRRLSDAGAITGSLDHVAGAPRRVWCYSLTPRGERAARNLPGTGTAPPATGRDPGVVPRDR